MRHTLPGERVRARITDGSDGDRFWRADAVEVLMPSADRVAPPCLYAGPGLCGGCDWQHASQTAQRQLKATVVAEQLQRLAGIEWDVVVEPVGSDGSFPSSTGKRVSAGSLPSSTGKRVSAEFGWRTRVTYAVDAQGRAGLRGHRSHDIVPVDTCLIAHPGVRSLGVESRRWPAGSSVEAVASSTGERFVVVAGPGSAKRLPKLGPDVSMVRSGDDGTLERLHGRTHVTERAAGRSWRVTGGGFWQVHPGAADTLVGAVLDALDPQPGETALDLYCGVGLFAGALAGCLGTDGSVLAVDGARQAVADARRNLHDQPGVELVAGRVERVLGRPEAPATADLVVLDPPRTGAKAAVVSAVARRAPRAIAYVACDPAALARDLATFAELGYALTGLRAFDLFPMTHHVECVVTLHPVPPARS